MSIGEHDPEQLKKAILQAVVRMEIAASDLQQNRLDRVRHRRQMCNKAWKTYSTNSRATVGQPRLGVNYHSTPHLEHAQINPDETDSCTTHGNSSCHDCGRRA